MTEHTKEKKKERGGRGERLAFRIEKDNSQ